MTKNTVNDYEADNAILAEVEAMLVEIGVYEAEEAPGFFDNALNVGLKGLNDFTYMVFGAKGFFDFIPSIVSK